MRFIFISLVLTWLWIWLFRKIVVEEIGVRQKILESIANPVQESESTTKAPTTRPRIKHISRNPLALFWFSTFTYFIADIWRVWVNFIFGLYPMQRNELGDEMDNRL